MTEREERPAETMAGPARQAVLRYEARLVFSGRGADYFRIWALHTALNLLTLGLYSPWAKVRKMRWFAQHTQLLGDCFDYHADPRRLLLGRVLGLALLTAYSLAFYISEISGWLMLAALFALAPLLFASSQRFRLANSSWRGLRFGFRMPLSRVYLIGLPALLLWELDRFLEKGGMSGDDWQWLLLPLLVFLGLMPWVHARLKAGQHRHAYFGARRFAYRVPVRRFYGVYLKLFALLVAVVVPLLFLLGLLTAALRRPDAAQSGWPAFHLPLTLLLMAVVWLLVWPFFAALMQRVVWSGTRLGSLRFVGELQAWRLWRLTLGQMLLVILSLGLYWPFAAVAIARYRLQSLALVSRRPWHEHRFLAVPAAGGLAVADASADLFGLDLGW